MPICVNFNVNLVFSGSNPCGDQQRIRKQNNRVIKKKKKVASPKSLAHCQTVWRIAKVKDSLPIILVCSYSKGSSVEIVKESLVHHLNDA